ncbi:MAG: nucleotidyltransferase domain-containing protein [Patescibacteria group bacterium]|nr:nucleotidyltransferase domain-containing protein [Patescibacteria group bacterium]
MAKKKVPIKVKKEIDKYIEALKKNKLPLKKVILFGSYAKGTQHQWSDIDLCIVSPKFKNTFDATQYLWSKRKISDVKYAIEPIGFSPRDFKDNTSITFEIKKTGIEIPIDVE